MFVRTVRSNYTHHAIRNHATVIATTSAFAVIQRKRTMQALIWTEARESLTEPTIKVTISRLAKSETSILLCGQYDCTAYMQPYREECKQHNHNKIYRTNSEFRVFTNPKASDLYLATPSCPYCGSNKVDERILPRVQNNWGFCKDCNRGFPIERDL